MRFLSIQTISKMLFILSPLEKKIQNSLDIDIGKKAAQQFSPECFIRDRCETTTWLKPKIAWYFQRGKCKWGKIMPDLGLFIVPSLLKIFPYKNMASDI